MIGRESGRGAGGSFTSSALSRFVVLKFGLRVVVEGKKIG